MQDAPKIEGELTVTPAEIIEYVRTHAVEHATQTARDRVNFFFTFIAVLFAIVSAVGAAVLIEFNSRLETIATNAAAVAVEKESEQLSERFAVQIEDLEAEVKQEIRAFSSDLLVLPLLVAEAGKADASAEYGERIITVLEDITDTIMSLSGDERTLALRMMESIVDNFLAVGDYARIYRVYGLLGNQSLELGGFHITMLLTVATSTIIDPERYLDSDLYEQIVGYEYDANDSALRAHTVFARLVVEAIRNETSSDDVATMYANARREVDSEFMDRIASGFIRGTRQEFVEGGRHHSPAALQRFERISVPIEAVILEEQ